MKKYKVYLASTPGFYAQYDGAVTVLANSDEEAIKAALRKLKAGSFSDRSDSMWRVLKVERVLNERKS